MTTPMVDVKGGIEGFYQLTVRDAATGKITKQTAPFKNLITNAGLDYCFIGFAGPAVLQIFQGAYVGTGNTAPANTDTQLTTFLASTNSYNGGVTQMNSWVYVAASGGTPPYWTSTGTWTFGVGVATGTLAEVGIGGWISTAPNYVLQSHALIVDGTGTPTTITVLPTEQLTLTYTLNLYWNVTTQTGTINISGTTYATSWLPTNIITTPGKPSPLVNYGSQRLTAYNGALGTPLTNPSGSSGYVTTGTYGTYSVGSYYQQITYSAAVGSLNLTGGITVLVVTTSFHQFQIGFSPAIPKDNTYTFTFICNFSLARYP